MKTQWSVVTSMLFQLLLIEATSLVEQEYENTMVHRDQHVIPTPPDRGHFFS
jgi:hypothetical protein